VQPEHQSTFDPIAYSLDLKEARVKHAREIAEIERDINRLGGDMDIAEIVALMVRRGWKAPCQ
jgi:hypothetical protein